MVRSGGLYLSTLSSLLLKSPAVEDFISNRGIKLEFIDLEESVTNRTVHKSDGGTRFKKLKFCLFLYSKYKHLILIEILILNFFEFWILNFGESRLNQSQTNKSEKDENLSNFGSWRTCFWR